VRNPGRLSLLVLLFRDAGHSLSVELSRKPTEDCHPYLLLNCISVGRLTPMTCPGAKKGRDARSGYPRARWSPGHAASDCWERARTAEELANQTSWCIRRTEPAPNAIFGHRAAASDGHSPSKRVIGAQPTRGSLVGGHPSRRPAITRPPGHHLLGTQASGTQALGVNADRYPHHFVAKEVFAVDQPPARG
jgi:hypothetical protein